MNVFNAQVQQSFEQDGNIDPIFLVSFIESLYISASSMQSIFGAPKAPLYCFQK